MSQHTRTAADEQETTETALTRDTLFDLLGNRRRRLVLRYLRQAGRTDIGDLADQIAAWENDTAIERVAYAERKRAYTSLQQTHLPALAEAGVIAFDADCGTVETTDRARRLNVYLEVVPERNVPWSIYYLGVGALSCVLVGIAAVTDSLALVPDLGWAALVAVTLTASATVHTYQSRSMRVDDTGPFREGWRGR